MHPSNGHSQTRDENEKEINKIDVAIGQAFYGKAEQVVQSHNDQGNYQVKQGKHPIFHSPGSSFEIRVLSQYF